MNSLYPALVPNTCWVQRHRSLRQSFAFEIMRQFVKRRNEPNGGFQPTRWKQEMFHWGLSPDIGYTGIPISLIYNII